MWIFAHRFHAEYKVATVLAPFLLRAPDYDLQLVLSTQIADEYRHMQAVFRVYEAVFGISAPGEVRAIADAHLDVIASTLYDALDHRQAAGDVGRPGRLPDGDRCVPPRRGGSDRPHGPDARRGTVRGVRRLSRACRRPAARLPRRSATHRYRRLVLPPRMAEDEAQREVITDFVEYFADLSSGLETALAGGMDTQVMSGYGVEAEEFYAVAMRFWQTRLRSIGFIE